MSVAEIHADGPFTAMPGYRRWLAVIAGDLTLDGADVGGWRGRRGDAIELDGAARVEARVAGVVRVWNVIARAGVSWKATWARAGAVIVLPAGTSIVHAPGTRAAIEIGDARYDLAADETLVVDAGSPLSLTLETEAIVVCFPDRRDVRALR